MVCRSAHSWPNQLHRPYGKLTLGLKKLAVPNFTISKLPSTRDPVFLKWILSPHGKPVDNQSGDLLEELPMEEKTDSGWKHPAPVGRWFIPISSHYLDLCLGMSGVFRSLKTTNCFRIYESSTVCPFLILMKSLLFILKPPELARNLMPILKDFSSGK